MGYEINTRLAWLTRHTRGSRKTRHTIDFYPTPKSPNSKKEQCESRVSARHAESAPSRRKQTCAYGCGHITCKKVRSSRKWDEDGQNKDVHRSTYLVNASCTKKYCLTPLRGRLFLETLGWQSPHAALWNISVGFLLPTASMGRKRLPSASRLVVLVQIAQIPMS